MLQMALRKNILFRDRLGRKIDFVTISIIALERYINKIEFGLSFTQSERCRERRHLGKPPEASGPAPL